LHEEFEFEFTSDIEELLEKCGGTGDKLSFTDFISLFESSSDDAKSMKSFISVIFRYYFCSH